MHSSKSEPQRTKTRSPSLSHFKCGEGPIAHVEHQARARPPNDQRETKRVQVLRHSARQLRLERYARTSKIADPVKPTDRLFIVAIVQNPEGVKQVKIHWQSAPQCKPLGDIGCKVGPGLTVPSTLQLGGAIWHARTWASAGQSASKPSGSWQWRRSRPNF